MSWKIRFKGQEFLLVSGNQEEGAIATEYQYSNGLCSYAHLYKNGEVHRYREVIGTKKDIEFLELIEEPEINDNAFHNLFSHSSWD